MRDRFFAKVKKTSTCWLWTGATNRAGYGRFGVSGDNRLAHRVSWLLEHGQLSDSDHVLHRCDNPPCVNPAHLFLGTNHDNVMDKMSKGRHHGPKKTHCPKGHPYSGDNLWLSKRNERTCLACAAERSKKALAAKPNAKEVVSQRNREYHEKNRERINAKKRERYLLTK